MVAIRHNVVLGERMVAIASSVTRKPGAQGLPVDTQCLLRVMHTAFDAGVGVLDFGLNPSPDEQRWCNQFVPVSDRYLPLTAIGKVVALGAIGWQAVRRAASGLMIGHPARQLGGALAGLSHGKPPAGAARGPIEPGLHADEAHARDEAR